MKRQGTPMLRHGGKARKAKRHSTARTPCALRYWEKNKKGAMLKHYPSFQEFILAQRHLQSPSRTPLHQTPLSSEPGSARMPLFCHCTLSASPCPCCTQQVFSTTMVLLHTHSPPLNTAAYFYHLLFSFGVI